MRAADDEIVRIESWGEDDEVRSLLHEGHEERAGGPRSKERVDPALISGMRHEHEAVAQALARIEARRFVTTPADVLTMFDKVATHRCLTDAGVAMPRLYGTARGYEGVRRLMDEHGTTRAFVKANYSSSASGVVAFRASAAREQATTSIELDDGRLYNTLRVRSYTRPTDVGALFDLLGRESSTPTEPGLLVEEWVPKGSIGGRTFDLRVVVIDGEPGHIVVRTSRSPMTNLHLGNQRGDLAETRSAYAEIWDEVLEVATRAAAAFGDALHVGVDVGITPTRDRTVVFEVNAFGDLLPGIVDARGRSTYEAEVEALVTPCAPE